MTLLNHPPQIELVTVSNFYGTSDPDQLNESSRFSSPTSAISRVLVPSLFERIDACLLQADALSEKSFEITKIRHFDYKGVKWTIINHL